ncbi:alpha/beta hydrolase [Parachlamydia sp. AcF125]|uniref:alpha/beta hydrolase n=1 Tax=Parachlamydia sp. AcF125 TaxID=2795736 RepID=UPI001BCA406A|nr:alpha/beta hydrolase [Parachlamydia sp. AcF125]MBS4167637.1 hypothetical protein [Parachlamydia sp. AcF125]
MLPNSSLSSSSSSFSLSSSVSLASNDDDEQQLYLISNRKNFIDRYEFSMSTKIARVFFSSREKAEEDFEQFIDHNAEKFKKRKILILIHGFTVTYEGAVDTLEQVAYEVNKSYDIVIGYLYPAGAKFYQYSKAKKRGLRAARAYLSNILRRIQPLAQRLDIAAHSMGTIVAMNALNQSQSPKINNLFLLGGAINETSIFDCDGHKCTHLQQALTNASKIYIFYSCNDAILPWLHLFNPTQTVGSPGEEILKKPIAHNVYLINTTSIVKDHSGYYKSQEIFEFFKKAVDCSDRKEDLSDRYFTFESGKLTSHLKPKICPRKDGIWLTIRTQLPIPKRKPNSFSQTTIEATTIYGTENIFSTHYNTENWKNDLYTL